MVNGRSINSYAKKIENTDYRPVTCLPKIYKLLTSIISRCMQKYMDDENLMPNEQKRCCRGSKGGKDQLLISKAILQECKRKKKNCESHGLIIRKLVTGSHKVV
jgi:hypothetical protein